MSIQPNNGLPMPEGFQPYAIIEEKYIKSATVPSPDGSLMQTPSRYVEILLPNARMGASLPTDVAVGSLAYVLAEGVLVYFNGSSWSEVGGGSGGK